MSRFDADYGGIREMLNANYMQAEMLRRAEAGKAFAVAEAPYDSAHEGDHYRDHFSASSGVTGGKAGDRAYGRVTNDSAHAVYVELGGRGTPAHHVLGRSLDTMRQ